MITAVVLTKNEQNNIVDCLESLSFCDNILLIDDNSTDNTVELAKKYKVKTIKHSLDGDFANQRNFALSQVKSGWVLFVDADERITQQLGQEIVKVTKSDNSTNGYFILRKDRLFGRFLEHGELRHKYFLRLARINVGEWKGVVHETWNVKGETAKLTNFIIHEPHKTIREFLSEINFYTTLRAEELYKKRASSSFLSILLYTKLKFIHIYFYKLGFLDGMPGLIVSLMMSFHSFLVRSKLYLLYISHEQKNS